MTLPEIIVIVGAWMGQDPSSLPPFRVEVRPLLDAEIALSIRGPETLAMFNTGTGLMILTPDAPDNVAAHEVCHVYQLARGEKYTWRTVKRLEAECEDIQYRYWKEFEQ